MFIKVKSAYFIKVPETFSAPSEWINLANACRIQDLSTEHLPKVGIKFSNQDNLVVRYDNERAEVILRELDRIQKIQEMELKDED